MSSGEEFKPADGLALERLAAIEQIWLEEAATLLRTAPGSREREISQRTYVVGLYARLEWETEHGARLNQAATAKRLNELFHTGLGRAALANDAEVSVHMFHSYRGWEEYLRHHIGDHIRVRGTLPASHYDLLLQLKTGAASFE